MKKRPKSRRRLRLPPKSSQDRRGAIAGAQGRPQHSPGQAPSAALRQVLARAERSVEQAFREDTGMSFSPAALEVFLKSAWEVKPVGAFPAEEFHRFCRRPILAANVLGRFAYLRKQLRAGNEAEASLALVGFRIGRGWMTVLELPAVVRDRRRSHADKKLSDKELWRRWEAFQRCHLKSDNAKATQAAKELGLSRTTIFASAREARRRERSVELWSIHHSSKPTT
jgi:AraC-like DNA-binding protein